MMGAAPGLVSSAHRVASIQAYGWPTRRGQFHAVWCSYYQATEARPMGAKIIIEKNLEMPMRDGCVLRGDLFRPDSQEKLPVLLTRTPYDKKFPQISYNMLDVIRAAQRGYNVMIVDCRGRFASDGVFTCFVDEARDGYDTIEWAARQAWADGQVGMFGASYVGVTQWLAATQTPPALKAMIPSI